MKLLSISSVVAFSAISIAFSLFYSFLYFFKSSDPYVPAQAIYLILGLLGLFVHNEIKSQMRRITKLENRIRDLEK